MASAADRHAGSETPRSPVGDQKPNQSGSSPVKTFFRQLGPGLVTGASDDDPSGIATYSQVGAHFEYGMLWTMFFSYPLMAAFQEVCARIGRVTGGGLAANLRRHYSRWLLYFVLSLMAVANIFNLGADLGAMGAAAHLILPWDTKLYVLIFGIVSVLAVLFIPYSDYSRYLKWLTLSLFAYVGTAFYVHLRWSEVMHAVLIPKLELNREYLTALIAVLGTTISPYLFFWQATQEVEEVKNNPGEEALKKAPRQARVQLERIRMDTYVGMAFSNVVAFFIILTTAATLHAHGINDVSSSAQAALALEPLAGRYAFLFFVCGILGTGMLAVPVLAGSAAYGIGEAQRWRTSLERKPREAIRFYGAIVVATMVGGALNFHGIDPIKALYWSAVLNGMVAAPLMVVIMLMACSPKVMGKFCIPRYLRVVGWLATVVMVCVCLGMLATWK